MRYATSLRLAVSSSLLVAAVMMLFLATGCEQSNLDPGELYPDWVKGRVFDESGKGVYNAAILLTYCLPSETMVTRDPPDTVAATTRISDPCTGEIVRTMVAEMIDPYFVNWDVVWDGRNDAGRIVSSGPYDYHIETSDTTITGELFLNYEGFPSDADPDDYVFRTLTNAEGYFEFSQECLAFGHEVVFLDELGEPMDPFTISRYVRLWALHEDYLTASSEDSLYVHPQTGARFYLEVHTPERGSMKASVKASE